jgi:hypothetical protein
MDVMVCEMGPDFFFRQCWESANLTLEQRHLLILQGFNTNQAGIRVVEKERGDVTQREGTMGCLHPADDSSQCLLLRKDTYFQRKKWGLLELLTIGTFKRGTIVVATRWT